MGSLKGRTAIRVFKYFPNLKKRPYRGNHFCPKDIVSISLASTLRRYETAFSMKKRENEKKNNGGFGSNHPTGNSPASSEGKASSSPSRGRKQN